MRHVFHNAEEEDCKMQRLLVWVVTLELLSAAATTKLSYSA